MLTKNLTYLEGIGIAYQCARESLDPSTQTGAILVDRSRGIVARSCNRLTRGYSFEEIKTREEKYRYVIHAERGALQSACAQGIRGTGLILVCPWAACVECAKCIVDSGVEEVVAHKECMALTPDRWKEEIEAAKRVMDRGGVKYTLVTGVTGQKIRFDGKEIEL